MRMLEIENRCAGNRAVDLNSTLSALSNFIKLD